MLLFITLAQIVSGSLHAHSSYPIAKLDGYYKWSRSINESDCPKSIQIETGRSSLRLTNLDNNRVWLDWENIDGGRTCYKLDAAGRFFSPMKCEKIVSLSNGVQSKGCDNDWGFACSDWRWFSTITQQDRNSIQVGYRNESGSPVTVSTCSYIRN